LENKNEIVAKQKLQTFPIWVFQVLATLHFSRYMIDFGYYLMYHLPLVINGTFFNDIYWLLSALPMTIELLTGILFLMRKKIAVILYSPILLYLSIGALILWSTVLTDLIKLIFYSSLVLEVILCLYFGISWIKS